MREERIGILSTTRVPGEVGGGGCGAHNEVSATDAGKGLALNSAQVAGGGRRAGNTALIATAGGRCYADCVVAGALGRTPTV